MPGARYLRKRTSSALVVGAPAEIDIMTAGELRAVLLEATGAGHPVVVVDMTRTRFCDATGLHALLAAHKRALAEGGGLRLVIPAGGAVSRVIGLTGLDRVIPCSSGLAGAVTPVPRGPARLVAGTGVPYQSPGSWS